MVVKVTCYNDRKEIMNTENGSRRNGGVEPNYPVVDTNNEKVFVVTTLKTLFKVKVDSHHIISIIIYWPKRDMGEIY